ncbi:hypothetical protein M405DRAFT_216754 [Rhizopogon salebrosus TDB-379]|nr:hypothetical protein M405DRAFT_216754 [Rhizopogon salebrosus TDB-379]
MAVCMVIRYMFQIYFVNCERFGAEGVESKLFELSDGGSVALPSSCTPTTHRSSGVNIICEDRRLQPLLRASYASSQTQMPNLLPLPGLSQHVSLSSKYFLNHPISHFRVEPTHIGQTPSRLREEL